jgi:hypothetical protein
MTTSYSQMGSQMHTNISQVFYLLTKCNGLLAHSQLLNYRA